MIVHTGKLLLSVVLPIKLTNANNGRGGSFWKTAKDRKEFEATLRKLGHVYSPIGFPVELRVTRLMGKRERRWDYSSGFRGSWKEVEDAIVACGWLVDDGPEWIAGITFEQEKSDSGKSEIRIDIFEADQKREPAEWQAKRSG